MKICEKLVVFLLVVSLLFCLGMVFVLPPALEIVCDNDGGRYVVSHYEHDGFAKYPIYHCVQD